MCHRRVKEECWIMGLRCHLERWEILGKNRYDGKGYAEFCFVHVKFEMPIVLAHRNSKQTIECVTFVLRLVVRDTPTDMGYTTVNMVHFRGMGMNDLTTGMNQMANTSSCGSLRQFELW